VKLKTRGMECRACEARIKAVVGKIDGVKSVDSDYATETTTVECEDYTDESEIRKAIESLGYSVGKLNVPSSERFGNFAIALGVFTILAVAYLTFRESISLDFSNISMEAGFAALFVLGFLTGFHCIGMCGAFVLAYSKSLKGPGDLVPHFLYGGGKTLSSTIIGALFGAAGSFIAFTVEMRAGVALIAGIFLVIYGLNMLNIFPILRKLQLRIPSILPKKERNPRGPFVTGLLNGLMIACGPLQALYIFAAGTGSAISGAQALFFFGLGTLFPLLTFGIASNFLSKTFSHNVVKFSGALVVLLGLAMASNGLNLLGIGLVGPNISPGADANEYLSIEGGYQVIEMNVTAYGWEPNSFVLRKGIPVKWRIFGKELNGCNNEIIVRDYGLDIKLRQGLQEVEFTPDEEGVIRWSCWMGMIPGQFIVTDSDNVSGTPEAGAGIPQLPAAGSCGSSCTGGCGCGCGR
jgi:sulfite exporter TauE/SafE/copper chaperone CopZ